MMIKVLFFAVSLLNYKLCFSSTDLETVQSEEKMIKKVKKEKIIIGWREWISLPELKMKNIKVKVDTGARTSSLHAYDIEYFKKGSKKWVKFKVHPDQKDSKKVVRCEAKLLEFRKIRSSNGATELRPVIETTAVLGISEWPIELTLTNRDEMGFRMLLGRASMKGIFLVDTGKSFLGTKNKDKKK
jgi:hypothetical protein